MYYMFIYKNAIHSICKYVYIIYKYTYLYIQYIYCNYNLRFNSRRVCVLHLYIYICINILRSALFL